MENFEIGSAAGNKNLKQPAPLKEDVDKPIPFDDGTSSAGVSHSPLPLGDSGTAKTPPPEMPKIEAPRPALQKAEEKKVSVNRVSGVKTFFTKLHPGALDFLDEQITKWLKDNPGVIIKRTNTVTGEIQAKKTEPNIIITVWY
jgi:hypothetical protein